MAAVGEDLSRLLVSQEIRAGGRRDAVRLEVRAAQVDVDLAVLSGDHVGTWVGTIGLEVRPVVLRLRALAKGSWICQVQRVWGASSDR